jgi:hypothetical protein
LEVELTSFRGLGTRLAQEISNRLDLLLEIAGIFQGGIAGMTIDVRKMSAMSGYWEVSERCDG